MADDVVLKLVQQTLEASDEVSRAVPQKGSPVLQPGWLLDGYPRSVAQAKQLDQYLSTRNQPLDFALYIDVDKNLIADRLKGFFPFLPLLLYVYTMCVLRSASAPSQRSYVSFGVGTSTGAR